MILNDVRGRWLARQEEWSRLGVRVDGATIAAEVLSDLAEVERANRDEALTLEEAAAESGYSGDHLRKLLAAGTLPNAGRRRHPLIRRADLPRKPGSDRPAGYDVDSDAISLTARRLARG